MNKTIDFAPAIAACFNDDHSLDGDALANAIRDLLRPDRAVPSSKAELHELDQHLNSLTQGRKIALVYGGATKIKGYIFESPKLSEIRGASALLDWINELQLPALWGATNSEKLADHGIIYSSGGNILAFASEREGQKRAQDIEHVYTEYTLTANSAAVCESFSLLELRYGRNPCAYWLEDFERDWADEHKRKTLEEYYYLPPEVQDSDPNFLQRRFLNRKCFGELVTVLATKFNRRRDERSYAGDTRSLPFYQMLPIAEKCDGSGSRPVVVTTLTGTDTRQLSEPTARKLVTGRIAKREFDNRSQLERDLDWEVPADLISWGQTSSWERRWERYITYEEGQQSFYAEHARLKHVRPAKDVHEIGAASNGYIGVIYADGNNVGRLIATLQTPQSYHSVSKILSNAARRAVFQALSHYIQPIESPKADNKIPFLYPFEILAIGGDDLFLIVPGNMAFDIAAAISSSFEWAITDALQAIPAIHLNPRAVSITSSKQRYAPKTPFNQKDYIPSIGLSAGVIIAQETAPIFFLRDLVEELLKGAKQKAKESAKQGFFGGAIDFMVMKSITMVTDKIKSFRKQALGDDGEYSLRRLTARPYSWYEFAGLLKTIRELKKVNMPRSQLYRLRRALDQEPGSAITPSVMEYLYTRTRLAPAYGKALNNHFEQAWCWQRPEPERSAALPPWMPLDKKGWESIWPDLLEMYEMVPKEEEV